MSTPSARSLVLAGGTGFVGRGLLARLAQAWSGEVRVWARRPAEGLPAAVRLDQVDLRDQAAVDAALPPGSMVVNLAYARNGRREENLAMAANLAAACVRRSAERLVHVSTAVVVGLVAQKWVTETTACRPVDEYQRTKLEIEARLASLTGGRVPLVILRPTAVFGWGGANLRKLVGDLLCASRVVNYVRSSLYGRRATHLVPVETVAAAVEFALSSPQAPGDGLYLVAEDEAPENSFRELERLLLKELGRHDYRIPPPPLPSWCLEATLRLNRRLVLRPDTRFSSARLRTAGFAPPLALREALERYARTAAEQGRSTARP